VSTINAPYGFQPVRHRYGGTVRTFALRGGIASTYAANVFRGSPVKQVTGGTYELSAATETTISAVFAGWLPEDGGVYNEGRYWKSGQTYSKAPIFLFWDIQDIIFSVQGAGSIAQTALGDACDHVQGTGNTRSGQSGAYLASGSLAGAGNSAQWKIVDIDPATDNAWGDTYTKVLVIANEINLGRVVGNAI
jgi:hypothetical protein